MKITEVSDLHLEFGYQTLPGGEVLILAGDVAEQRSISKHFHSTKPISDSPNESYRCSEFFEHECAKYDKVFYVMGNHEHYHGTFGKTAQLLRDFLPKNVTLLDNSFEEYNGVLFLGGTLWTDCNRHDPATIWALKRGMNDYHVITNHYASQDRYGKLIPEVTILEHEKTKNYFRDVLAENKEKPVVAITHHAPTYSSIDDRYKKDTLLNGGYASDVSDIILDHPNIKYWFHGHMHIPVDYMVGDTRVLSNPRGYLGHEDTSKFDPNFVVEI
jgi:hypothetical protein